MIKQEAGLGRTGQHLNPSIPPRLWQRWGFGWGGGGGGGSAIPAMSLEMIACPGAGKRGCAPAPHAGLSRKRNFFFNSLL